MGVITSATRSPVLKKTIALARVDVTHCELGTEVEVGKLDGHQKRLPARIVRFPHYDPDEDAGAFLRRSPRESIPRRPSP